MKSLYWVRNDIRLADNCTLTEFCVQSQSGFFVASETRSLQRAGNFRRHFYNESLFEFDKSLQNVNQKLFKTELLFADFLESFLLTNKIDALFFSEESASEERAEEQRVRQICQTHQITVRSYAQATVIASGDLPFKISDMPFVFTSFRKKVESALVLKPCIGIPTLWPKPLADCNDAEKFGFVAIEKQKVLNSQFIGGEAAATARLQHYVWDTQSVQNYKTTRNGLLDFDDSVKISPWLNLGCISGRTILSEIKKFENQVVQNESTYWVFFELLWRDYFKFFSLKYGSAIFKLQGVNSEKKYSYHNNKKLFQNWCQGQTQEAFINANMNELNATGWMSNRGRQNVASYLVHQLGLPWTWGAAYFEKMLIDYDPDVNWGNWLYLSGQGSDPRAREFNIERQASMYDASGEYQRKWT